MKNTEDIFKSNINYKKIIHRLLSYKGTYFFIIIVCLAVAFLINKYSPVKYKNNTTVYISQNKENNFMSGDDVMKGFGLFSGQNIIDNEVEILRSFSLIKKTINKLDIKTSYYSFKKSPFVDLLKSTPFVRKTELYTNTPIKVIIDQSYPQATYCDFSIQFINDNEFQLTTEGFDVEIYNYIDDKVVNIVDKINNKNRYKFGDEIKTQYYNFRIIKNEEYFDAAFTRTHELHFYLNNINNLTLEYQNNINPAPVSQTATLIDVSLKGTNPDRITDFLNMLTSVYLEYNLEKKNQIALSTVNFIDTQISDVADSLSSSESRLKSFRSANEVMELSYQGQQAIQKLSELETQKANLERQRNYYRDLKLYMERNTNVSDKVAPSSMNIVDPILTSLITQLIEKIAERDGLIRNNTSSENLYLNKTNSDITNLRRTISENVENSLNNLKTSINEINYRISKARSLVAKLPKIELQDQRIRTEFDLNKSIHEFLLQKRSEAQIARASSMPDYEVIDEARMW